jgi:hypothetical protein
VVEQPPFIVREVVCTMGEIVDGMIMGRIEMIYLEIVNFQRKKKDL